MPTRDPSVCCSQLQAALPFIIVEFDALDPRHRLFIVETGRTAEEQAAYYAKGRTEAGAIVTDCDGVTTFSKHQKQLRHGENAVHATDFGVLVDGLYERRDTGVYEPLVEILTRRGFRSGGAPDWRGRQRDFPHGECRTGGTA